MEQEIIKVEEQVEIIKSNKIKNMIYEIRGKQVMFDSDLSVLYGYKQGTKALNQAVRRNIDRFPEDFYFQITEKELISSRSQHVTLNKSNNNRGNNIKYLPYVFTEEGIAMLSSVLRTKNAAKINVEIMKAFVAMRHFIMDNTLIYQSLDNINNKLVNHETKLLEHDIKFDKVFMSFDSKEEKECIYFNGQIYDAYSKIVEIMNKAKRELIIIDGYADKSVLDMISNLKVKVTLICKTKTLLKPIDLEKYNKEYDNLNIIYNDDYHDRYLILDKSEVYHLGASINHAGAKTFSINKLEDKVLIESLINNVLTDKII